MKSISIFGATGSIGQSTIKVIESQPDRFDIITLTAHKNVKQLAADAIRLKAQYAVIADDSLYEELKARLSGSTVRAMAGRDAIIGAAQIPADLTMAAIMGFAGLEPLMASIQYSEVVAIANKEPLVAAGEIVRAAAKTHNTKILPVDSEHNAIFQVFDHNQKDAVERIILTASGGPFRDTPIDELKNVTVGQALNHPNWCMGNKISIDSATMMNKALEIIEAQQLFDMPTEKIEAIIHPQSIIHSMVEYCDGSILCQMGESDMCTPIAYALGWPDRMPSPGKKLDIKSMSDLTFRDIDPQKFPFVPMAYEALEAGVAARIAMNAANEIAVQAFLDHKIAFLQIYDLVSECLSLQECQNFTLCDIHSITKYDSIVRSHAEKQLQSLI